MPVVTARAAGRAILTVASTLFVVRDASGCLYTVDCCVHNARELERHEHGDHSEHDDAFE